MTCSAPLVGRATAAEQLRHQEMRRADAVALSLDGRTTGVYIPHGAVTAREARRGARFEVRGTLVGVDGTSYTAVPNVCLIP